MSAEKRADVQAVDSLLITGAALACYAITVIWLRALHAENLACKSPDTFFSWLVSWVYALPFFWLAVRHIRSWDEPWPSWGGPLVGVYAVCILMIAVSWGLYAGMIRRSAERDTRARLGELRDRISQDYIRNGSFAPDLSSFPGVPALRLPHTPHDRTAEVRVSSAADIQDSGKWLYYGKGDLLVDCTHKDDGGRAWSTY